jgi:hemerythrin-like domain-containing protein
MAEINTPTTVLREEHQVILSVLAALESFLNNNSTMDAQAVETLAKYASFLRLFADACHHGKEEDLLFPELEARGIPREGGPIGVMLAEHEQGRAFVRQMHEALPGARAGDTAAVDMLVAAGRAFIDLLRQHIEKENNILFMMADRVVDESSCARLCGEYAHVCGRQFDGRTKQQLRELADELIAGATAGS